jgi:hypothetical protein
MVETPAGFSAYPIRSTGMTSQSSGLTMWWLPSVYQSKTSVSSIGRLR